MCLCTIPTAGPVAALIANYLDAPLAEFALGAPGTAAGGAAELGEVAYGLLERFPQHCSRLRVGAAHPDPEQSRCDGAAGIDLVFDDDGNPAGILVSGAKLVPML
jgi:hypothetical protein